MKVFLRAVSLILVVSIIFVFLQIPYSAFAESYSATFEENPIIVKPFTEWESYSVASKSKQETVTPLTWTDSNGLKLTATAEYTNDYPANSLAFARYKTDTHYTLGDATHIIMYVKTDCANTLLPGFAYTGAYINASFDPIMSLGVGESYSYLPIGGSKWISANTVPTWKASSGDTDGDGISDTYFGGLAFGEAFEGYVKFAIADLSNDSARINRLDRSITKISFFNVSVSKIGGQYGTVTVGPFFLTDSDSDSSSLLTPEIEAEPFENYVVERAGAYGNSVYPIDSCDLRGETLNRNLKWDVPQTQFASISSCRLQFSSIEQAMNGTEGYMFYLSVPQNTTTTFYMVLNDPNDTSRWRFGYLPSMLPLAGEEFYFLAEGDSVWQSDELVYTNESGSKYRAGIYFESGFTGYIKIPYSSLGNDSGFKFDAEKDVLDSIVFYFDRFGGKYGQVVAGPNFFVLNDGTSNEIILKDNYKNSARQLDNYRVDKGSEIGTVCEDVIINKELKIKGSAVSNDTLLEYATNEEVGAQNKRFLNLNYSNESLNGSEGLLLYIKLPAGNLVTLSAMLEYPEDKSRWNWSYAPVLSLYEGQSCYVLPKDDNKWQIKTVVKASGNSYNGGIQFDSAFEGYIKIPYSALKNDSGLIFSAEKDILKAVSLRFKTVGGEYGIIEVSDTYILQKSSSSAEVSLVSNGEINVADCVNGAVTVDKDTAYSGQKINLTVTAEDGYTPKADGIYIEYSDYLGKKKQIVADYDKTENSYFFEMPKTSAVTVKCEFVSVEQQNFALLEPTVVDENSLEFTFREFENAYSASEKGVLIALKDSIGENELSVDLLDTDIINATLSVADNSFTLQEDRIYSDYKIRLNNIKSYNLDRDYVVRGYQIVNGEYYYTPSVIVSYNEACGPFSDYVSFSDIYANGSYKYISCSYNEIPFEELSFAGGIKAESQTVCDLSLSDVQDSSYWFSTGFNPIAISQFYYIGIYVKVPDVKDNLLYMNLGDTSGAYYHIPAGKEYILINKNTGKKDYKKTLEGENINSGVIAIPSGFEGLICLPVSSLNPQNSIKSKTQLNNVTYRFAYMGYGENAVTVGPIAGFKQKSRVIDGNEITSKLPLGSDAFKIDSEAIEMICDSAILYWDKCDNAENYLVKAYKKVIGGYYCVTENVLFSNSGALSCLEDGEEYELTLCARDKRDNVLAEYYTEKLNFKATEDFVDLIEEDIVYDAVDYSAGNIKGSPFVNRNYTTLNAFNSDLLNNNPNRGFRGCIDFFHFNLTDDAVKAEIEKDIKKIKENSFNGNVYVCYFYPGDYLGKDLGEEFFVTAQKIFDYLRENKIQILLRFAYFDVNNFNQRTPTTDEILSHIEQLSKNGIIERNKDVLHAFQVGFAGKYGEWHSDTPAATRADRYEVLNTFVEKLLPDGIYPQLRMPNFKDFLSAENMLKYGNRFGFHFDSYYGLMDGTETGSGQYSYGCADWDRHIAEACVTPNDAEVYYWQQFDDIGFYPEGYGAAIAAAQLRLTTFSAINGYLDQNVNASGCFNEWKKLPVTKDWFEYNNLPVTDGWLTNNNSEKINRNIYEYMRDYLGYRISAKNLSVTESQKGMNISLDLINYGFSAAFNISSRLVILDSENNVVYSESVGNPEEWYGTKTGIVPDGNLITHTLSADMPIPDTRNDYKIALQLISRSGATARLDNNIPYEDGYNILHTFSVAD